MRKLMLVLLLCACSQATTMRYSYCAPIAEMSAQAVVLQRWERIQADPQPQTCICMPFTPPWDCACQPRIP